MNTEHTAAPRLAIIPGDPSGIGPELIAKLLSAQDVKDEAHILLVGDSHLWRRGAEQASLELPLNTLAENSLDGFEGCAHLEMQTITPDEIRIAEVTEAGGRTSLRCLDKALDLAQNGTVDGILFAPFNKAAMTAAGLKFDDEHRYMAHYIGFTGHTCEINVLEELMTTRVTSHIGLREVAERIASDEIEKAIHLAQNTLTRAGLRRPRIAVAALNPHAGDSGKFGREEIDIIEPAVQACRRRQIDVSGPWPADTIFVRARRGDADAVVTMYHDQGQIAMKLMGFERGVSIAGGLPIPVATPAHGTAFDIAGQNKADPGATRQAFMLLARMTRTARAETNKTDRRTEK